jgi:hypothetical protein
METSPTECPIGEIAAVDRFEPPSAPNGIQRGRDMISDVARMSEWSLVHRAQ